MDPRIRKLQADKCSLRHGQTLCRSLSKLLGITDIPVAPCTDLIGSEQRKAPGFLRGALNLLLYKQAAVGNAVQLHIHIRRSFCCAEAPASRTVARNRPVSGKRKTFLLHNFQICKINIQAVEKHAIVPRRILRSYSGGQTFSRILKRCGDKPAVLIEEQLMHAHFMSLRSVVKTVMVKQIHPAVRILHDGVVPLCDKALLCMAPLVSGHHPVAHRGIEIRRLSPRVVARTVHVRPGHILRTENAHIVTALGGKSAERHIQKIVISELLNVGSLPGNPVPAGEMLSHIRIGLPLDVRINLGLIAQPGRFIQLYHVNSAGPGAVGHIPVSCIVHHNARVDRVRTVAPVPGRRGRACLPVVSGAGIGRHLITCGKPALSGNFLIIRAAEIMGRGGRGKSGIDHRPDIRPVPVQGICSQKADAGIPGTAVNAHIHAPFVQGFVPDHIRSPHIPVQRVGGIPHGRPCDFIRKDGIIDCLVVQVIRKSLPVNQIVRFRPGAMGAENIIGSRVLILNDARIMNAHARRKHIVRHFCVLLRYAVAGIQRQHLIAGKSAVIDSDVVDQAVKGRVPEIDAEEYILSRQRPGN